MNQMLDQILEILSDNNIIDKQMPQSITQNLNPNYPLRDYQIEAFARFIHGYHNGVSGNPMPRHLFFNMATGSGKTLIMAGLILYLYEQGYRNFLFFVNADNIIEKTKDNFVNQGSKKYLFNECIYLNGEQITIDKVENFDGANPDNINICFTTIQKLHSNLSTAREDALTFDDFAKKRIVLLSDEAHHINVATKEQMDLPLEQQKPSWENTVEKIFVANDQNLLLGFSATFEESNEAIVEKYKDKIIYQYDLVKFRNDKYSKDISIVRSDFKGTERMLQAIILHYYKQTVATNNGIQLKPVILFKSKKICESIENKDEFHKLIENLTGTQIKTIRQSSEVSIIKRAFRYFDEQQISSDKIARFLRENFEEKYCLAVNSKEERIDYQLEVNRLEDNAIRAIFAVQMLSEGWDVLNLFDIVRCYDTSSTNTTTTAEAQLIGRGARYFPFTLQGYEDKYKRKFDKDMKNDLRVIEELHYHSMNDSPYITEIKNELVKRGLMDEKVVSKNVKRKKSFKQSKLYKQGFIWLNDKVEKDMQQVNSFDDLTTLSVKQKYHEHTLSAGSGAATRILDNSDTYEITELETKDVALTKIGHNIVQAAIARNPFFRFDKLTLFFPNLRKMEVFRNSPDYLGGLTIKFRGLADQLYHLDDYPHEKLKACCDLLQKIEAEMKDQFTEYEGTTNFQMKPIQEIFDDKVLKFNKGNSRIKKKSRAFNKQFVKKKDWIAYNGLYGTSEERDLVKLIDEWIKNSPESYDEIYLVRNERHFKIYNFTDGRAFEPDFVLFLLQKNGETTTYQLFIEPKGEYLKERDEWKETFLKTIQEQGITHVLVDNHKYRILAVGQFYSEQVRDQFKEKLTSILQLATENEDV